MAPDRGWALLRARDRAGRTPLHVAAAAGRDADADPRVVRLLGSADPTTCAMLDGRGRTPLHLACDASSWRDDDGGGGAPGKMRGPPTCDVVRALLSESVAQASIEDDDGMSPLEYAILSDASLEVVHLLQKATAIAHQEGGGRVFVAKSSNTNHKRGLPEVVGVVSTTGTLEGRMYQGFTDMGTKHQRVSVSINYE